MTKKRKAWPRGRQFRSYAGMTRIRFKGPAQRHLSIVRCSPRNVWKVSCFAPAVNGRNRGENVVSARRYLDQTIWTTTFSRADFSAASASFSAIKPSWADGDGATLLSMASMKALISAA